MTAFEPECASFMPTTEGTDYAARWLSPIGFEVTPAGRAAVAHDTNPPIATDLLDEEEEEGDGIDVFQNMMGNYR